MTPGICDPPGKHSLMRQRNAGKVARLNQRIAELEAALAASQAEREYEFQRQYEAHLTREKGAE